MLPPAYPDQEPTPTNLNKGKSKDTKVENGVVLDKKAARPIAAPKEHPTTSQNRTPYEDRASLGYMPADPMQKAINDKPPVGNDPDMLRKGWTAKEHAKNTKAVDKHIKEKQTLEARNLKQVIGTQEGNSPEPVPINNNDK